MNFSDYYPLALRTAKAMPDDAGELRHAALGFIAELGEFVSEVKRIEIYGREMAEAMVAHMREELGDFNWYIPVMLRSRGLTELPPITAQQVEEVGAIEDLGNMALMLWATAAVAVLPSIRFKGEPIQLPDPTEVGEMAAVMIYLIDRIAIELGTTGDQIRDENIAKLRLRYPDTYSDAAAEARADKGGLSARES